MYYVYLLRSLKWNRFHVGYSTDLKRRFLEHNAGRVGSTKFYKPWELVYYEAYKNKLTVTKREKQLKNHAVKLDLIERLGFEAK